MAAPPTTYADSNERGNDPWDHDAVCWMLEQLSPSDWTYHNLFECARKQRNRMANDVERVIEAASVCGRLHVRQIELHDPKLGKVIVRLRRSDLDAPNYPAHYDDPHGPIGVRMKITAEDKAAAERLIKLLGPYEEELTAANKSRSTINTYVDRTDRFLRRVLAG